MKRIALLLLLCFAACSAHAQRAIKIRNLWAEPEVHVLFEGYKVSFLIKDINRALVLLTEAGDDTYGAISGLDTAKQYYVELFPGYRTEYRNALQPLLQKGVAAFLLMRGHAVVESPKHKKLKSIIADAQPIMEGVRVSNIKFYDPDNDKMIFNGQMSDGIRNADLGIE